MSNFSKKFIIYHKVHQLKREVLKMAQISRRMGLEECEDASAAQVHEGLKEHFTDLPNITEHTVLNFVLQVRSKHGVPKTFGYRDYSKVDESPYGKHPRCILENIT